jgi:hypothetical protein
VLQSSRLEHYCEALDCGSCLARNVDVSTPLWGPSEVRA